MVLAAVNEGLRSAQELQRRAEASTRARSTGGMRPRGLAAAPGAACRAVPSRALHAPPVQRLVTELGKLPGIGQRTAQRLAFHVLRADPEDALALADAIREVKERVGALRGLLQPRRGAALPDLPGRAPRRLADLRRRGAGRRHPARAHARVPRASTTSSAARCRPSTASIPRTCSIAELCARVETAAEPPIAEVVLATNPTTTGEATALHIAAGLRERAPQVAVTRLASGLPVGADLEYADEVTLGKALDGPPLAVGQGASRAPGRDRELTGEGDSAQRETPGSTRPVVTEPRLQPQHPAQARVSASSARMPRAPRSPSSVASTVTASRASVRRQVPTVDAVEQDRPLEEPGPGAPPAEMPRRSWKAIVLSSNIPTSSAPPRRRGRRRRGPGSGADYQRQAGLVALHLERGPRALQARRGRR